MFISGTTAGHRHRYTRHVEPTYWVILAPRMVRCEMPAGWNSMDRACCGPTHAPDEGARKADCLGQSESSTMRTKSATGRSTPWRRGRSDERLTSSEMGASRTGAVC